MADLIPFLVAARGSHNSRKEGSRGGGGDLKRNYPPVPMRRGRRGRRGRRRRDRNRQPPRRGCLHAGVGGRGQAVQAEHIRLTPRVLKASCGFHSLKVHPLSKTLVSYCPSTRGTSTARRATWWTGSRRRAPAPAGTGSSAPWDGCGPAPVRRRRRLNNT